MKQEHWLAAWLERGMLTSLGFHQKGVKRNPDTFCSIISVSLNVLSDRACREGPLGSWCCKSCCTNTAPYCSWVFPTLPQRSDIPVFLQCRWCTEAEIQGQLYKPLNSSRDPRPFAGGFCKLQVPFCIFRGLKTALDLLLRDLSRPQHWFMACGGLRHEIGNASLVRDSEGWGSGMRMWQGMEERCIRGLRYIFLQFLGEEWCPWGAKFWGLPHPARAEVFWPSLYSCIVRTWGQGRVAMSVWCIAHQEHVWFILLCRFFSPCIHRKHGINDIDWLKWCLPSLLWKLN